MLDMKQQMALPNPRDFCTAAYAAEKIGVSIRQVYRWCKPGGPLISAQPRVGSRETGRRHSLLLVAQVEEFALAYKLTRNRGEDVPAYAG